MPVASFGWRVIDVMERPERSDGALFRSDPCADGVSPRSEVLSGCNGGTYAGFSAIGNQIPLVEIAMCFESKGTNWHASIDLFEFGVVFGCYASIFAAASVVGEEPQVGV